jgi:hypothetical protein
MHLPAVIDQQHHRTAPAPCEANACVSVSQPLYLFFCFAALQIAQEKFGKSYEELGSE